MRRQMRLASKAPRIRRYPPRLGDTSRDPRRGGELRLQPRSDGRCARARARAAVRRSLPRLHRAAAAAQGADRSRCRAERIASSASRELSRAEALQGSVDRDLPPLMRQPAAIARAGSERVVFAPAKPRLRLSDSNRPPGGSILRSSASWMTASVSSRNRSRAARSPRCNGAAMYGAAPKFLPVTSALGEHSGHVEVKRLDAVEIALCNIAFGKRANRRKELRGAGREPERAGAAIIIRPRHRQKSAELRDARTSGAIPGFGDQRRARSLSPTIRRSSDDA